MGIKLLIAEKPSVAKDIAGVLGGVKRQNGYLDTNSYTVTWAVGHLVTLADAHDYDEKYARWSMSDLPILPNPFKLKVIPASKDQYKVVSGLLKQADEVVVATDAGREGQLIYELIAASVGYKGETKRLWLSSMTEEAIKEALGKLRDNNEYKNLYYAGFARSQADWLVGINATRAMTLQAGGKLTIGRVQTPTLAMIVNRDREIENFKPVPYFEVEAIFTHQNGDYKGKWFKDKQNRFDQKSDADSIVQKINAKPATITKLEQKSSEEKAPQLFDLTSLQRRANQLHGFTADQTLKIAQSLYETHKVLTYPRTDSRYISHDIVPTLESRLKSATKTFPEFEKHVPSNIAPGKRVVDDKKVSDHHAIIPTPQALSSQLSSDERAIYELVTKQTIAALMESAQWAGTTIETVVEGETFKTSGRVLIKDGWRAIMGSQLDEDDKKTDDEDSTSLPKVVQGDSCETKESNTLSKQTKPPARFTEASLLSSMENAGKQVEDDELAEALKERGLGTPATRASIIEKLKKDEYIQVEKKKLVSTDKGRVLINAITVDVLKSPEMTGDWEFKLKQMEQGDYTLNQFIGDIQSFTVDVLSQIQQSDIHIDHPEREIVGKCPVCGGDIIEGQKSYSCSNWQTKECKFGVWKEVSGHKMTSQEVKDLLSNGKTGVIRFKSSKTGNPFDAILKISAENKVEFELQQLQREVLGKCPLCGGDVVETPKTYGCSNWKDKGCKFGVWKEISGHKITISQVKELLSKGKTKPLKFKSSKTGKDFEAMLVLKPDGKVEFEFPTPVKSGAKKK